MSPPRPSRPGRFRPGPLPSAPAYRHSALPTASGCVAAHTGERGGRLVGRGGGYVVKIYFSPFRAFSVLIRTCIFFRPPLAGDSEPVGAKPSIPSDKRTNKQRGDGGGGLPSAMLFPPPMFAASNLR